MRRHAARLLALAGALALAGCAATPPTPAVEATPAAGRIEVLPLTTPPDLPAQRVRVWLPAGYDPAAQRRYPVLYMWDGQNLFDPAETHYGKAWEVPRVLDAMVAAGTAEPHIVVALDSPPGLDRYRLYLPQPAADTLTGALADDVARMAGGPLASARELDWLAATVKPAIDAAYKTRRGAADTTVVGASMGGVMACYAALERPDVFGRAGCVSAHWPIASPELAAAHRETVVAAWQRWLAGEAGRMRGQRLWLDHGDVGLDGYYGPFQDGVARALVARGWREGEDFTARVYPGAEHDEIYWRRRMPDMLAWLWRTD